MTAPEPEYVVVQPGLDGVAWLGEVIDGELSPIGKISDLLSGPATAWEEGFEAGHLWEQVGPAGIPHDPPLNPYAEAASS